MKNQLPNRRRGLSSRSWIVGANDRGLRGGVSVDVVSLEEPNLSSLLMSLPSESLKGMIGTSVKY